MDNIRFHVAPYALQDVIEALQVEDKYYRNEVFVTKEDGGLVVVAIKQYKPINTCSEDNTSGY